MAKELQLPRQEQAVPQMVESDIQLRAHRALYSSATIDLLNLSCGHSPQKIFRTQLEKSRLQEE
jgi:hypothetical protein